MNFYNFTPIKIPSCEAWHSLVAWPASQHTAHFWKVTEPSLDFFFNIFHPEVL
jgi:hypothetical protein